ncbi:MAG TPA: zinc-dependent metalloprotease [Acidimicrobiales bacterium]|jgi:putative hydrolase
MGDPASPDPFEGIPLFGDLARMLQRQGPVAWDTARALAASVASGGAPEANVDPFDRMAFEQLVRVADLRVADLTGLATSVTGRGVTAVTVTRAGWAARTLEAWRPLFERLAGAQAGAVSAQGDEDDGDDPATAMLGGLLQLVAPMMLGMSAGSMVGNLAIRAFGQYDLPIPRPPSDELLFVPANIDRFAEDWSLPRDDVRLWVCLSEVCHHAVLGVPHVRRRLEHLVGEYVAGFRADSGAFEAKLERLDPTDPQSLASVQQLLGDPEFLLGTAQSPAQEALLPRLEALVAVVEGVVDHVMDATGGALMSSYGMLTEAARRHRVEAAPADRFTSKLFGLDLPQRVYDRGAAFVDGVVERAGREGLERLWRSERELPTPAEVDAPGLWLARIDLLD